MIDERTLTRLEKKHAAGVTSADILDVFASHDVPLSEATLRKYVQLGLLPRSVRVGRKGKHKGSQGVYPVGVIRQILRIKQMMADNYTIDEIRRQFLFIRSDIQQLEQTLVVIFEKLKGVTDERTEEGPRGVVAKEISDAEQLSRDLLDRLQSVEAKLMNRAEMERATGS